MLVIQQWTMGNVPACVVWVRQEGVIVLASTGSQRAPPAGAGLPAADPAWHGRRPAMAGDGDGSSSVWAVAAEGVPQLLRRCGDAADELHAVDDLPHGRHHQGRQLPHSCLHKHNAASCHWHRGAKCLLLRTPWLLGITCGADRTRKPRHRASEDPAAPLAPCRGAAQPPCAQSDASMPFAGAFNCHLACQIKGLHKCQT